MNSCDKRRGFNAIILPDEDVDVPSVEETCNEISVSEVLAKIISIFSQTNNNFKLKLKLGGNIPID